MNAHTQARLKERIRFLVKRYADMRERVYSKRPARKMSQMVALKEIRTLLNYYIHKTYLQHCRMVQQSEKYLIEIRPERFEEDRQQQAFIDVCNVIRHCKEELRSKQLRLAV